MIDTRSRSTIAALLSLAVTGCAQSQPPPQPVATRAAQTAVIEIVIDEYPTGTISGGEFMLTGTVECDMSLSEDQPLVLYVDDLDEEMWGWIDVKKYVRGNPETLCEFDAETGEFVIDGETELQIQAGNKRLRLVATAADDTTDEFTTTVFVTDTVSPTTAEVRAARVLYGAEIMEIAAAYQTFVQQFSYMPPNTTITALDEGAFPHLALDNAVLAELVGALDVLLVSAPIGERSTELITHEEALDTILDIPSPLVTAEDHYRANLSNTIGWIRFNAEAMTAMDRAEIIRGQDEVGWFLQSANEIHYDFFNHTFADAQVTADPETGLPVFEARIYHDVGRPNIHASDGYDHENLEPETADPEHPAWLLRVEAVDSNEDDEVDSLLIEGFTDQDGRMDLEEPVENSAIDDLWDTDAYEHLITPLRYLFVTRNFWY